MNLRFGLSIKHRREIIQEVVLPLQVCNPVSEYWPKTEISLKINEPI